MDLASIEIQVFDKDLLFRDKCLGQGVRELARLRNGADWLVCARPPARLCVRACVQLSSRSANLPTKSPAVCGSLCALPARLTPCSCFRVRYCISHAVRRGADQTSNRAGAATVRIVWAFDDDLSRLLNSEPVEFANHRRALVAAVVEDEAEYF
jgi:hypothetical protein